MALRFRSVYVAGCFHGTADTAGRLGPNYVASQSHMALLSKVLSKVEQLNLYRIAVCSRIRRRRRSILLVFQLCKMDYRISALALQSIIRFLRRF